MSSSWSYSGDKWLLFAREDREKIIFTAIVTLENNVLAELKVDEAALKRHVNSPTIRFTLLLSCCNSEDLGLEMDEKQFRTLLLARKKKALEQRQCVNVEVDNEDEVNEVIFLSLTYKFSPTISRKGIFHLPIVANDVSLTIVNLLSSIHATPPCPMLSEQEQREKREKQVVSIASKADSGDKSAENSKKRAENATNALDGSTSTVLVNPMLLKRRHVPSGTMFVTKICSAS
ncbi:hypothetical protein PsorP6_015046 [Peronosclerospora sorghi]|uniref:Uncharacterized protein n=1 Tax=Peronosclerospora sorghi TaxID=230839 RepID=A0ACC0VU44_9STRA|nr:hypothetical protein PsorP6_015046 [Peronosclerospora sorghi]